MLYKEIIQGSFEWKELRYRKIGGSSAEKVMANLGKPVTNNAIFAEILGEFCEDYEFEEGGFLSADVNRGNELEPIARFEFQRIYGKSVFEIGWAESSIFTGISPDGIIGDVALINAIEDVEEAIEIKCPSRTTYAKYLIDNSIAITDYAWQIVTYFLVFKNLKKLNLFIYRPENAIASHILIELTRESIVMVNKNKGGDIDNLCKELSERQKELLISINAKITELSELKNNF